MTELKGGGKPEAIQEQGRTVARLRDMTQQPEWKNFDNTKMWIVGENESEDRMPMEIKLREEKRAKRRWQEPYERKVTLEELAKEHAEQNG